MIYTPRLGGPWLKRWKRNTDKYRKVESAASVAQGREQLFVQSNFFDGYRANPRLRPALSRRLK